MALRKWFVAVAVTLSLAAAAALWLPLYTTILTDGEAATLVVRGYNLVEFSPWGGVVVTAPLVVIGLLLSKLKFDVKTVGLLGLVLLDGFALCAAVPAARQWVGAVATGPVRPCVGHWLYGVLLLAAMVCSWAVAAYGDE